MVCKKVARHIRPGAKRSRLSGFSLVELVVVIVITGVIASVIGVFISGPVQGFFDQARRARLVDAGQLALIRMGRDLRAALPNSIRSTGAAVELLLTVDGDRYRTEPPGDADDRLEFNAADTSFNTFRQLGAGQVLPAGLRLAVYPLGQGGADPYQDDVLTPASVSVNVAAGTSNCCTDTEYRVTMTPGHRFPYESPSHRVFLVSGPVTYHCSGGSLLRYDGYSINPPPQVAPPTGATSALIIAEVVQSCAFRYDPGTAQRNAVVAITLELADPDAPAEVVRLARQVHLGNTP